MAKTNKIIHTPYAHVGHIHKCGCFTDQYKILLANQGEHIMEMAVCKCGAAYEWAEVITFAFFECYDCGRAAR